MSKNAAEQYYLFSRASFIFSKFIVSIPWWSAFVRSLTDNHLEEGDFLWGAFKKLDTVSKSLIAGKMLTH
jgi:hypothetical protein